MLSPALVGALKQAILLNQSGDGAAAAEPTAASVTLREGRSLAYNTTEEETTVTLDGQGLTLRDGVSEDMVRTELEAVRDVVELARVVNTRF